MAMNKKKRKIQLSIVIGFFCIFLVSEMMYRLKPMYEERGRGRYLFKLLRGTFKQHQNIQLIAKTRHLLTIFTTWVSDKKKYVCRNNTVKNWNLLQENVERILFTNETDLTLRVKSMGWKVLPVTKVASTTKVPVLKDMFYSSFQAEDSIFYAYANGDIIFTNDLTETLKAILKSNLSEADDLLLIGRRTDVRNVTTAEAVNQDVLKNTANNRGSLHPSYGIDYFIIKKSYPFFDFPDIVIGRAKVDGFLVSEAVNRDPGHVIDITMTSLVVHQVTLPGEQGVHEGETKPDRDYNYNLLKSRNPHYSRGKTNCAQYYTFFDTNMTIAIHKRQHNNDKNC